MRHSLCFVLVLCLFHYSIIPFPSSAQSSYLPAPQWISPYPPGATNEKIPCPILRSTFTVIGPVKTATVRIVGLGHYELFLNGKMGRPFSVQSALVLAHKDNLLAGVRHQQNSQKGGERLGCDAR